MYKSSSFQTRSSKPSQHYTSMESDEFDEDDMADNYEVKEMEIDSDTDVGSPGEKIYMIKVTQHAA